MEIERKWLVRPADVERAKTGHTSIANLVQGYLVVADDGAELRVRMKLIAPPMVSVTYKGVGTLAREEREILLSAEQTQAFPRLLELCHERVLSKTRFALPDGGELDVYQRPEGLVVYEHEFASHEAAATFVAPQFCGVEVTGDKRFKNQVLAMVGLDSEAGKLLKRS
jgi:CYTH domain-containing protein